MKKAAAFALCILLLLCSSPALGLNGGFAVISRAAAKNLSGSLSDTITYNFVAKEYTLYINGNGAMPDFAKPTATPWYNSTYYSKYIYYVVIEDGITNIPDYFLSNGGNLNSITIPDSVSSIGKQSLATSIRITDLVLPASIKSVGESAFQSSNGFKTATLTGVTSLGDKAFYNCEYLTSVSFPVIETIGSNIFFNCSNLTDIYLPRTAKSIADDAFSRTIKIHGYHGTYAEEYAESINRKLYPIHDLSTIVESELVSIDGDMRTYKCSICDEEYVVDMSTHEHSYTAEITKEATCAEKGEKTFTCSVCGDSYSEETAVDPDNHSGATRLVGEAAATCAKAGYTGDTVCTSCNAVISVGESIPPTGEHSYTAEITKEATCAEKGEKVFTCSVCGDSYSEDTAVDPDNHSGATRLVGEATATCAKAGYTGDTVCSSCNAVISVGESIPPTGEHSYTAEITKEATCAEKGEKTFTCSVCGDSYSEEIAVDPDNHSGATRLVGEAAATCAKAGYTGDTVCPSCNAVISMGESIPPTGEHSYSEPEWSLDEENGKATAVFTCESCGNEKIIEAEAAKEEVSPATAEKDQVIRYTASISFEGETYTFESEEISVDGTATGEPDVPSKDPEGCKWCGRPHNRFPGQIIHFFHNILYFFANLFGRK